MKKTQHKIGLVLAILLAIFLIYSYPNFFVIIFAIILPVLEFLVIKKEKFNLFTRYGLIYIQGGCLTTIGLLIYGWSNLTVFSIYQAGAIIIAITTTVVPSVMYLLGLVQSKATPKFMEVPQNSIIIKLGLIVFGIFILTGLYLTLFK
jgi:hypothetical protein